jgi:hypothetical protein
LLAHDIYLSQRFDFTQTYSNENPNRPFSAKASFSYPFSPKPNLPAPSVQETTDAIIILSEEGKPIFQYLKKPSTEANRYAPHFSRTGYIHPLYSPSGRVITGDYAADHPHQHGLFFAWTKSSFRGKPTEFWNQKKQLGDIRFKGSEWKTEKSGKIILESEQIFTTGKDSDEPILTETWQIEIPAKQKEYYQFDLISTQYCATDDPLLIQKYHYGGMAMRGNDQWMEKNKNGKPVGKMITSEDKSRENGNHSRPRWVAYVWPGRWRNLRGGGDEPSGQFPLPTMGTLTSYDALLCLRSHGARIPSRSSLVSSMYQNSATSHTTEPPIAMQSRVPGKNG